MMATSSTEVNRLRSEIHLWHADVRTKFKLIARYVIGSKFDDPGILDTLSDLLVDEDGRQEVNSILRSLIDRDPLPGECKEWEGLIQSSRMPAQCKRARTLRALDDPFWRARPAPSSECDNIIQSLSLTLSRAQEKAAAGSWTAGSKSVEGQTMNEALVRTGWLLKALELVRLAGLPTSVKLGDTRSAERLFLRLAGGRRIGTIKKDVRNMLNFSEWCSSTLGKCFPEDWLEVNLYLEDLSKIPCGPSVPKSVIQALGFFELLGGVRESGMLSKDLSVLACAKDIEVELTTSRPVTRKKKAPQLALAMVVSLEYSVADAQAPLYQRLYDWTKLIRHWACLRWSDTRFAPPKLARWTVEGLSMVLTRTKTTGPGKKVDLVYAYVSVKAFIQHPEWLTIGWHLFKELAPWDRDYWLPLPTSSLDGFKDKFPKFNEALLLNRRAGSELRAITATRLATGVVYDPMVNEDGSKEKLFETYAQIYWKLHGDRSGFVNWLIVLGYPKDIRSVAGRWSPSGSDEYLRTQRSITWRVQTEVAAKIRAGQDLHFLGEGDLWQDFSDWADGVGMSKGQRDWQIKKFRMAFADSFLVPFESPIALSDVDDSDFEAPRIPHAQTDDRGVELQQWVAPRLQLDTDTEDETNDPTLPDNPAGMVTGQFVVSFNNKGTKRTLHRIGRCWRKPGTHYAYFKVLDEIDTLEQVNKDEFQAVCRDCYPAGKRRVDPLAGEDERDSSSDSSSQTTVEVNRDLDLEVLEPFEDVDSVG